MKLLQSPAKIAGVLCLLSAGLSLPFWYVLLFTATPSRLSVGQAALQQLRFSFSSEAPARELLILWALLPIASLAIGAAYLGNAARNRGVAIGLVVASAAIALAVLAMAGWSEAIFFALPVFFGAKCVRSA
jgi:hypothetical protein